MFYAILCMSVGFIIGAISATGFLVMYTIEEDEKEAKQRDMMNRVNQYGKHVDLKL